MARPKKEDTGIVTAPEVPTSLHETIKDKEGPKKVLAKAMHMVVGLDLIGSTTSVTHKKAELEVTPIGIKMTSKGTGRVVVIPYTNVKGFELL